jgi:predicted nucleic acid-binding protein
VAERQVTFVDTNVLAYAALYAEWPVVQVDVPLILAASELEEHHTLSCWDARVVEAARRSGRGPAVDRGPPAWAGGRRGQDRQPFA